LCKQLEQQPSKTVTKSIKHFIDAGFKLIDVETGRWFLALQGAEREPERWDVIL
jgi:hypothetical protein